MSLPYIPGWWDEISKNATAFAGQLPQMIQPDRVANKKLQEMVQQNPMLLEQFSNMDEGTRNMLAQSLGFKNENPIAKLPVGAARKERDYQQGLRNEVMSDPASRAEALATQFGTKTPKQRQAEDVTLEGRILDNKTGKLKLDVLEKEVARNEAILSKAAPELAPLARALAFGQQVPTEALQRIYADDTLNKAFQDYYKAFQFGREADLRKTLASMKTPQEKLMAIGWVEKELDNTRQQIIPLRAKVRGREGFMTQLSDPATYKADADELTRLETRLQQLENTYADEAEKMGTKLPKNNVIAPTAPVTPGPLANPASRPPLGQIDNALFGKR